MLNVFVSAYPTSGIQRATVTVQATPRAYTTLTVGAGGYAPDKLDLSTFPIRVSLELSVESAEGRVTVYADGVHRDGEVHVLGVAPDLFLGRILDTPIPSGGSAQQVTPGTCILRCQKSDPPTYGPGCIECQHRRLKFDVCC